jgi:hypothetical protein
VLILQDTTTFSYQRERPELIGYTGKTTMRTGKNGVGPRQPLTQCGILMHSSLAVTADGLPLGLAAVKFWTRKQFKGLLSSNVTSIPRVYRLRRRKAGAGWRICASRLNFSTILCAAYPAGGAQSAWRSSPFPGPDVIALAMPFAVRVNML